MMTSSMIEQWVESLARMAVGEGQRVLRIKALAAALQVVQGLRLLLILQYVLVISCFLFAGSFFALLWSILEPLSRGQPVLLSFPVYFFASVLLLSGFVLFLTVREKSWMRVLDLNRRMAELESSNEPQAEVPVGLSRQEITELVSEVIDRKLSRQALETHPGTQKSS